MAEPGRTEIGGVLPGAELNLVRFCRQSSWILMTIVVRFGVRKIPLGKNGWQRWKERGLSFQTVKKSSKTVTMAPSYGQILLRPGSADRPGRTDFGPVLPGAELPRHKKNGRYVTF